MKQKLFDGSDFEKIGGKEGVERIIKQFVDRVYNDVIIGFFFREIEKENLMAREVEFASQHLGGPCQYTGRPIGAVHKKHPINKGHFHRRLWILKEVLMACDVPRDVQKRWLEHNRSLENAVTNGTDCVV